MNIKNFNVNDFHTDVYIVRTIYYDSDGEEDNDEYINVKSYQEAIHFLKWNYERLKKEASDEIKRFYRPEDIYRNGEEPLECVIYPDLKNAYIYDTISSVYMYQIEILKLSNIQDYFKMGYEPI